MFKLAPTFFFLTFPLISTAAVLQVGAGKPYATPCKALLAAHDGDTIQIAAALYSGDVCSFFQNNLIIQGINGRPHLYAAGHSSENKGIWVSYGSNLLIDNIEFSGAVSTSDNGAGLRATGQNWTVRHCYFHDNQEGILESNIARSNILIEYSEFNHNGYSSGQSHNVYIGHAASLVFRYNWSHNGIGGELLKTRAATNTIVYNRLTGESGRASYELDIPNGGTSYVIGNIIQQGPYSPNDNIVAYMEEGASSLNPGHSLYLVNNTIVNNRSQGNFVLVGSQDTTPILLQNNILYGPGTITNKSGAIEESNLTTNPEFVNASAYNYQLQSTSPAINHGTLPSVVNTISLTPVNQFVNPTCGQVRLLVGTIDIGAYEYGGGSTLLACN